MKLNKPKKLVLHVQSVCNLEFIFKSGFRKEEFSCFFVHCVCLGSGRKDNKSHPFTTGWDLPEKAACSRKPSRFGISPLYNTASLQKCRKGEI